MLQETGTATTNASDPAPGLLLQFLVWVDARPRSYGETMDAWRTSCPRISVWEDALGDGLVRVDGDGAEVQGEARVSLTPVGRDRLSRVGTAPAAAPGTVSDAATTAARA